MHDNGVLLTLVTRPAGLRKGVTGKTVDGRYTGKEPEPTSSGVTQRQTAGVA